MQNPRQTLEGLTRTGHNAQLLDFAEAFDPKTDSAYIWGPVGTGKTHVARVIVNRAGHAGQLLRAASIPRFVRQAFDIDGVTEGDLIRTFCGGKISTMQYYIPGIQVLGIDDIAVEKMSEYAESIICEILDRRYDAGMAGLVVTSNLSLDDLAAKIGSERIASRLAQQCKVFDLTGERDWRIKQCP